MVWKHPSAGAFLAHVHCRRTRTAWDSRVICNRWLPTAVGGECPRISSPVPEVFKLLGHALIAMTEIYTQVAIRKVKTVHANTHPRA